MKKTAVIMAMAIMIFSAGCATFSRSYKLGVNAEMNRDYEGAVRHFQKASADDPKNSAYRVAFTRARSMASIQFLQKARVLSAQHKKDEAIAAYRKALYYDPMNRAVMEEMRSLDRPAPAPAKAAAGLSMQGPLSLRNGRDKLNLAFRTEVSVKSMLKAIGRMSGINVLFDEQFRDGNLAVDLSGKEVEQAVRFICATTKNFLPHNRRQDHSRRPGQHAEETAVRAERHKDLLPFERQRSGRPAAADRHNEERLQGPQHPGRQDPEFDDRQGHSPGRGHDRQDHPQVGQAQRGSADRRRDHGDITAEGRGPRP